MPRFALTAWALLSSGGARGLGTPAPFLFPMRPWGAAARGRAWQNGQDNEGAAAALAACCALAGILTALTQNPLTRPSCRAFAETPPAQTAEGPLS